MLPFNWTTLKKPQLYEEKYYWVYEANIAIAEVSESEKRQAVTNGLRELVLFYGKVFPADPTSLLEASLQDIKIFLDPRPNCYIIKVLVSASVTDLDNLTDLKYNIEELQVLNLTTQKFHDGMKELLVAVTRHEAYTKLWGKFLHVDDAIVDLNAKMKLISRYENELIERALLNDVLYQVSDSDFLQLLFKDNKFIGAILNNKPLIRGGYTKYSALTDILINNLLSNGEEVFEEVTRANSTREKESWQEFYRRNIRYGIVTFKIPDRESSDFEQRAQQIIKNTKVPYFLESRENRILREWQNIKDIPRQLIGAKCGPLDLDEFGSDASRLYSAVKTRNMKEAEDMMLNNSTFRAEIHDRNINRLDYVGDVIFNTMPDIFPNGPSSLNEVYENVLNYISIDLLVKKSIQCLLVQAELPDLWKYCIDVYVPFSLTLTDNLNIPDLFGFISDLIVKAILFIVQQALFLLIDTILDALNKCINGELIDTGASSALEYFGDNFDAANAFLAKKVYENLDSLQEAIPLVEDEFSDTSSLLEDIAAALTPQEFCMVMSGTATNEVYKIILCIIETRYPLMKDKINTVDKVRTVFSALGALVNADKCSIETLIPIPVNPNLCLTKEQLNIRRDFLKNKYSDISSNTLQQQLEEAESRRKDTIDRLNKFLTSKDPLGEEIFKNQTQEQFAINLSPCAQDNEPMRHMIELATDSTIDSLSSYFIQATIGDTGLASLLTNTNREEYKAEIRKPDFVQKTQNGFSVGSGPSQIRYTTINNGYTQVIGVDGIELYSESVTQPETANFVDNARIEYFKSLNNELDDDDYDSVFILMSQFITKIIADSSIFSASDQRLKTAFQAIVSSTTGRSDIYENCWQNGINVRDGINDSYFEKDCETRDTTLYTQASLAGLIRLYIRTVMIEFFMKNIAIITQFHSKDFFNTFIIDYCRTLISPIISSIDKTQFIDNIDGLVEQELDIVYNEFKTLFNNFTNIRIQNSNKNIVNYFFNNLKVFEEDPKNVIDRFFFVSEATFDQTRNEMTVNLHFKYAKKFGFKPKIVTLITAKKKITNPQLIADEVQTTINRLKTEIKNSRKALLLFGFSIPVNHILSFIAIYNTTRIRNNIFEQLFIMNENVVTNLENSDNFVYRNTSSERRNKVQQVNSLKQDKRKSNLKELLDK